MLRNDEFIDVAALKEWLGIAHRGAQPPPFSIHPGCCNVASFCGRRQCGATYSASVAFRILAEAELLDTEFCAQPIAPYLKADVLSVDSFRRAGQQPG